MAIQWFIFIGVMIASWLVQQNLQRKFKKYSAVMNESGLTGQQIAEKMLRDNGIYDVRVTHVSGQLTDHYNPVTKTVNLSQGVYESNSVMAAAVACGAFGGLGLGICPARVKKLMVSTNIDGQRLAKDYPLSYSLEDAFRDWFKDCDGKVLE